MPSPDVYDRAAAQLAGGSLQLLTSDVFDTLVWRDVAQPADLFLRWRDDLVAAGLLPAHVTGEDFRRGRVFAERSARRTRMRIEGSEECTLEQIWAEMPDRWCLAPRATYVGAELDLERATLRVHQPAVALLADAKRLGLVVALVSDTYFSTHQLTELLRSAGVPTEAVDHVFTSSEVGVSKASGLLARAIGTLGVDPRHVLHMGDHPEADVRTATTLGAQVARVSIDDGDDHHPGAATAMERVSQAFGTDGGRSAMVRETLLRAGSLGTNPSYQFGAAVAGPLLAGFAGWVADTTRQLGGTTTHCLLREGAVIAELIDAMRPGHPTRLVHASRWAITRAAVVDGDPDELDEALARRAALTAEHVAEAFGVDARLVAEVIGPHPVHHAQRPTAIEALAAHDELRGQIVDSSRRLRQRVMAYLHRSVDLDASPLVLSDIGWGGTIQVGLTRILRAEQVDTEIIGLYLMLSSTGLHRVAHGHRMLGYIPADSQQYGHGTTVSALARNLELLERITTPPLGTLIDFTDTGEPVTRATGADDRPASLVDAQQGLRDVTARLASVAAAATWSHSVPFRLGLAAATAASIQAPSAAFAAEAGQWPHDDVAGAGAETLLAADERLPIRYLNVHDARDVDMTEIFWLPGRLALDQPALSGLFAAAATGIDTDLLAPASPLGEAYLAAFPLGSALAAGVHRTVPRINTDGWALLHLRATLPSIRAVEISFGQHAGLVEVGALNVSVDGQPAWEADGPAELGHRLQLHRARRVGPSLFAVDQGGHLVVYPPAGVREHGGVLRAVVAFRAWPLDGENADLVRTGPVREQLQRIARVAARKMR